MRRLLIVGCGDVAGRAIPLLQKHYRILALLRDPARGAELRALGVVPVAGDLDDRRSLRRLAGLAHAVLHLAPPPGEGRHDTRTRNLLAALSLGASPKQLVYISTSGVYGDCGGAWVDETRPVHPQTARAQRRADAEQQIRGWAERNGVKAAILRVPGIHAEDRLPLERLRAGTPSIVAAEDGYANHIHADDLARILVAALRRAGPNRIYHASDDAPTKPGDYLDALADASGLPHPPRISRAEAQRMLPETLLSFINESRRLSNGRMKRELEVVLRYPVPEVLLEQMRAARSYPRGMPAPFW